MALSVGALLLFLAIPAVYAATHNVGDNSGWNTGVNYNTWANGQTFNVGDALVFKYDSSHGVDVVSQEGYSNCDNGNALQSFTGGSTTVPITTAGPMYFVCSNSFHCGQGMKLSINVKDASGPPSGSTPATPASPATPSGSSTPGTTPPASNSPATRSSPDLPSAATGTYGSINHLMVGLSLALVAMAFRA